MSGELEVIWCCMWGMQLTSIYDHAADDIDSNVLAMERMM